VTKDKKPGRRSLTDRIVDATQQVVQGMSELAGAVHPLSGPASAADPGSMGKARGPRSAKRRKNTTKNKKILGRRRTRNPR
jgi:hypothetical protein